ncbi:hypothetical protein A0H81_12326 [Grifola frondosa]|uniref:Uncharacterized protein n=1 Tax=Grifola frondosa TaxID=5627 RepID=A0A1C7LT32_GRIFR|nr:hypothetical protein A0H81_12326 [Grifola frondosa]
MPSFTLPPRLASPSGKLARRRQLSAQILGSPTPKSTSASRRKDKTAAQSGRDASFPILGVPVSKLAFATPSRRIPTRRASTGLPVSDWDSFPICDDSADLAQDSDVTPPSTPIRESASVPFKKGARLAAVDFNNGPRTAPISSAFRFPFVSSSPCPSPSPSHRRRYHQRVPSDGVFNLSMDEDSSSSTSDLLELIKRAPVSIPKHRSQSEPASSPTQSRALAAEHPVSSSAPEAGYYADFVKCIVRTYSGPIDAFIISLTIIFLP